jgi:hypothetical protein
VTESSHRPGVLEALRGSASPPVGFGVLLIAPHGLAPEPPSGGGECPVAVITPPFPLGAVRSALRAIFPESS